MADLLSHALLAHALGRSRLSPASLGWLVTGSLMPDVVNRAPLFAMQRFIEPSAAYLAGPIRDLHTGLLVLHTPALGLVLAAIVALALPRRLLPPPGRLGVFGLLGGGALLHVLTDLVQRHPLPTYRLLYPWSAETFELGLVSSTASIKALPLLIALCVAVELRARRREAARGGGPSGSP